MSELETIIAKRGVHPALGDQGEGWWIEQSPYELAVFFDAIGSLKIRTVLEIGTGHKMGLARFMSEIMGWRVVSVDIHNPEYIAPLVDLRISQTRLDFPDTRFDLLIIDADHAYDSVKADYEHYGKYADKVIMFHDIAGLRQCEGSAKFWLEISRHPNLELNDGYYEIFADGSGRCGIGWIDLQAAKVATSEIADSVDELPAQPPAPKERKKPGRKPKAKTQ